MTIDNFIVIGGWVVGTLGSIAAGWFKYTQWRAQQDKESSKALRDEAKQLIEDFRTERDAANKRMADMQTRFDREIQECRDECNRHMGELAGLKVSIAKYEVLEIQNRDRIRDLERQLGYADRQ